MKLFIYLFHIYFETIFSYSIIAIPFEVNEIKFSNKKYSSTELIKLLFIKEFYTPIYLGSEKKKYFGLISLEDRHPILSEKNCKKIELFQDNKNIIKDKYIIYNSKSSKFLGNGTNYFNRIKYVEVFSERFSYFNTTLIKENDNNNLIETELILVKDNSTELINQEMCLTIGLAPSVRAFLNPEPPHFIESLYQKKIIRKRYWTFKFNGTENNGFLIIGDKPEEYENDTIKYSENNYTESYSIPTYFRPWATTMKEIYFYNNSNDKIVVNKNNNKFTIMYNFGFIIGSNLYKDLIYNNYFSYLIEKKICKLEISEKTIYNSTNYYIDTDGSYSIFICDKEKMKNYIKKFPVLYFPHIDFNYIFELTYKDLFLSINNNYYFMIIFPNNQTSKDPVEKWHIGLPFLKKYQFILKYDSDTIGFYRAKNFQEEENPFSKGKSEKSKNKIIIYFWQSLIVIILIVISIFIGKILSKQRKKRANELTDDYDYIEENDNDTEKNKNKLIN